MKNENVIVIVISIVLLLSGLVFYQLGLVSSNSNSIDSKVMGQDYVVAIKNHSYSPEVLNVIVGSNVTWVNVDSMVNTVTSDYGDELNSGSISSGETYSHVFNRTGNFTYHETYYPRIKGQVIVR